MFVTFDTFDMCFIWSLLGLCALSEQTDCVGTAQYVLLFINPNVFAFIQLPSLAFDQSTIEIYTERARSSGHQLICQLCQWQSNVNHVLIVDSAPSYYRRQAHRIAIALFILLRESWRSSSSRSLPIWRSSCLISANQSIIRFDRTVGRQSVSRSQTDWLWLGMVVVESGIRRIQSQLIAGV